MFSKSLVFHASLQMLIVTLNVAPIRAFPTGDSLRQRDDSPPVGDYSPDWQQCNVPTASTVKVLAHQLLSLIDFQVTDPLPGINFTLGNNYAGNIAVQRPQFPDDTLFFWGFETSPGSLTAPAGQSNDQPWAVWLQGG